MKIRVASTLAIATLASLFLNIQPSQAEYFFPSVMNPEGRRAALHQRIVDGLSSGRLTTDDARTLSRDLQEIATRMATIKQKHFGLSPKQTERCWADLDRLSSRIDLQMRNRTSIASNTGIQSRYISLDRKIDLSVARGLITPTHATQLKKALNKVARKQNNYMSTRGGLTYWERNLLNSDLDKISYRLDQHITKQRLSLRF